MSRFKAKVNLAITGRKLKENGATMSKRRIGLLVMAYGTPEREADILPYYTHIRHGREPAAELVADLAARYQSIGGISPLAKNTKDQVDALVNKLNQMQEVALFVPYIGLKHITPFIEEAVTAIHRDGIEEAVSIVLAPHYSTMSIQSYNDRAAEAAAKLGNLKISSIDSWYKEEHFIQYWAGSVKTELDKLTEAEKNHALVIYSAHSLPERIRKQNDPYESQLAETADMISLAAGIEEYVTAWQSAGKSPEPWLGPDVLDLTRDYYDKGYRTFIYVPVGFVADHLEVLYDNDTECKELTDELGANYYRATMPNTNETFIKAMANTVLAQLL